MSTSPAAAPTRRGRAVAEPFRLEWSHGTATVLPECAMLREVLFRLPGGGFSPLAPPLPDARDSAGACTGDRGEAGDTALPLHLAVLGGEFVCLPFGSATTLEDPAPGWRDLVPDSPGHPPHGPSANAVWDVLSRERDSVTLGLTYPLESPVVGVRRTIRGVPGSPELALSLTVVARRAVTTSLGLHPILRLPDRPGSLRLTVPFREGWTYPGTVPPGRPATLPGRRFSALNAVPGAAGPVDMTRLPLSDPSGPAVEDVVLLGGVRGPVTASYLDEGAAVRITWDTGVLPSVSLWLSDRALADAPWNSAYRGLGVEPVAAAFDLPDGVSTGANPVAASGTATSVRLDPARPLTLDYRLTALPLAARDAAADGARGDGGSTERAARGD